MRIPYQALLSIPFVLSTTAMANNLHFNNDYKNGTGEPATDYHVRLKSADGKHNIHVSETFECTHCSSVNNNVKWASSSFDVPVVTNNDTPNVVINWVMPAGKTTGIDQWQHVGLTASSPDKIRIAQSFWTDNSQKLESAPILTPQFTGSTDHVLTARINVFADEAHTHQLGSIWAQGPGTAIDVTNFAEAGTFANVALIPISASSPGLLPLASLNDNLAPRLGAVTDLGFIAPVPEPETYAMLLAGLGLLGFMARRRKIS